MIKRLVSAVSAGILFIMLGACTNIKHKEQSEKLLCAQQQVWVVNTFTMKTEHEPEVVANLQLELVRNVKANWPGFISQQTLISQDRRIVRTIEVWSDMNALKTIASDPQLVAYRNRILEHADMQPIVHKLYGSTVK